MLKIRKEQYEELAKVALKQFENTMVEHIQAHFPKPAQISGEKAVRTTIQYGFERSKTYGFKTEHEVCLYIDLMIILGSGFDTEPQLPWISQLLKSEDFSNASKKIEALYDKVLEYLDRVVGKDEVLPVKAMRKFQQYSTAQLDHKFKNNLVQDAIDFFRIIWPDKCQCIGNAALVQMFKEGNKLAKEHGISVSSGIGIYSTFMFILGHQFARDPMYPWACDILDDSSIIGPTEKINRLHAKTIEILKKSLE
ncbi:MAG TPA: hypothetical protein HPP87_03490 [Planctomycetes bacterium]|nr:hypothetical protein [Planctomycetota bacterium]